MVFLLALSRVHVLPKDTTDDLAVEVFVSDPLISSTASASSPSRSPGGHLWKFTDSETTRRPRGRNCRSPPVGQTHFSGWNVP